MVHNKLQLEQEQRDQLIRDIANYRVDYAWDMVQEDEYQAFHDWLFYLFYDSLLKEVENITLEELKEYHEYTIGYPDA